MPKFKPEHKKADNQLKTGVVSASFNSDAPVDYELLSKPEVIEGITPEYFDTIFSGSRLAKGTKEEVLALINDIIAGENMAAIAEAFKSNVINAISSVFPKGGGKIGLREFVNAARYVTYTNAGFTKQKAYTMTFPDRVIDMQNSGQNMANLSSAVAAYERSKAVTLIQAEMVVPIHLLYGNVFHQAIVTQAEIMTDPKVSPKVRSDAANSLMTHLKPPEQSKAELNIKVNDGGVVEQLRQALVGLNQIQRNALESGSKSLADVAKMEILMQEKDNGE